MAHSEPTQSIYDTVIVGGGIAGLYSAYRLLQLQPETKLLLVEKQAYLGGRIFTYTDDTMTVEGGAGRFTKRHSLLWRLLKELGLDSKAVPISGGFTYIDGSNGFKVYEGPEKDIAEVVKASTSETLSYLRSVSFLDFAKRVIGPSRAQHIVDSFGYYSELVIMNAHDAIVLMDVLERPDFYALAGGLSQIIVELEKRIREYPNVEIWTKTSVQRFSMSGGGHSKTTYRRKTMNRRTKKTIRRTSHDGLYSFGFSDVKNSGRDVTQVPLGAEGVQGNSGERSSKEFRRVVYSNRCIFAVPKQALEKLSAFRPVRPLLKQIACGSLCRIYSQFPKDKLSPLDVLYEKKYTVNNDLRMIIPIDRKTGVVMISYTDNRFADEWHAIEKEESIEAVDAKIAGLVRDTLDITLPKPLKTKVFYWPCGVGYWKVGANSLAVSKRIIQPFSGEKVYVCGEHYSEKNQQWIEGALETSEVMLDRFWGF